MTTAKIASKPSSSSVRKDLNWLGFTDDKSPGKKSKTQPKPEHRQWLRIGDPRRKLWFAEQIARDAVFLAEMKIMDYSLLVGVHGRDRNIVPGYSLGIAEDEEEYDDFDEDMMSEDGDEDAVSLDESHDMDPDHTALASSPGGDSRNRRSYSNSEASDEPADRTSPLGIRSSTESGVWDGEDDDNESLPLSVFQRDHGGFEGRNADGSVNNEIYYVGIIDILQQYNVRKFGENKLKSWFTNQGTKKISAVSSKAIREVVHRFHCEVHQVVLRDSVHT